MPSVSNPRRRELVANLLKGARERPLSHGKKKRPGVRARTGGEIPRFGNELLEELVQEVNREPMSDKEIIRLATANGSPPPRVVLYSELTRYRNLLELFGGAWGVFLLAERRPNVGHWLLLFLRPVGDAAVLSFFDSYAAGGGRPDALFKSIHSFPPELCDGKQLTRLIGNLPCEFNPYCLQTDESSTCGRFAALRYLMRDADGETFARILGATPDIAVTLITSLY